MLDDFGGRLGSAWRETGAEAARLETVIAVRFGAGQEPRAGRVEGDALRAASVGAPPGQITTTGISARLSSIDHAPNKNPARDWRSGAGQEWAACFSSLNSVLLKCEKCNTKKDRRKAAGRG